MWELDNIESWGQNIWCFWTVMLENTLENPLDCRRSNQSVLRRSVLSVHLKDWHCSWNSSTVRRADSLENTLMLGGIEDRRTRRRQRIRRWMALKPQWAWVWLNSGSLWWTGRPGLLWSTWSQRVGHDWENELNRTEPMYECESSTIKNAHCERPETLKLSCWRWLLRAPWRGRR